MKKKNKKTKKTNYKPIYSKQNNENIHLIEKTLSLEKYKP